MSESTAPKFAIVVDGYSAGNFFADAFATFGSRLVHVQSTAELMSTMLAPDLSRYADNVILTNGALDSEVLDQLRAYAPVCVIAGQESAVALADELGENLGLPTNGTALSVARRNKYEMIEALRHAGVPCARQLKGSVPADLADWADETSGYPAVIKPLSSAATDGVFICANRLEVLAAAELVLKVPDIFGNENTEVLIQEYLKGPEYIVDTVSSDGCNYVCGIWKYEKELLSTGQNIYDKDILVDSTDAVIPSLASYVFDVLRALDIRWGPAHAEVILTGDGPVLVEIGARLNGNMHPGFHDACLGHNQATLSAAAFLRPEEFNDLASQRIYTRRQLAIVYNAPSILEGIVEGINSDVVTHIEELDSVYLASVKLRPGSQIFKTVDLLTTPLRVFLTADSQEELDQDYTEIRRLKDSVYKVI